MGQNIQKQAIGSRRSTAFNSLTPRASTIMVGSTRPLSVQMNASTKSLNRVNSSGALGYSVSGPSQIILQQPMINTVVPVVTQNPYMLQPILSHNQHFAPKSILKNRTVLTAQFPNPQLSIFSTIPTAVPQPLPSQPSQLPQPPQQNPNNAQQHNFNFTTSEYLHNPLLSLQPYSSCASLPGNNFQTFGNMNIPSTLPSYQPSFTYKPQVKNVPLTPSIMNIQSSISNNNSKQISSELQLLSFVDQPTKNQGFDRFNYQINTMKVYKVNIS